LRKIAVTHIGLKARLLLAAEKAATVMGTSSRGIFLRLPSEWVLFLSFERYRGPLTLNLDVGQGDVSVLAKGAGLQIDLGRLRFPSAGLEIDYEGAEDWQAPSRPDTLLSIEQRDERLERVLLKLAEMQRTSPLAEMLPGLLGLEMGENAQGETVFNVLVALRQALIRQNSPSIIAAIQPLLGRGAGLTPSGDDLAVGLLLALSRWGHVLVPGLNINELGQEILRIAYERTTLLSASLIACASLGQADERLILGLDNIMSRGQDPEMCAIYFSSWGNTSGIDALVGMALAFVTHLSWRIPAPQN
jgi:hypothetical protein